MHGELAVQYSRTQEWERREVGFNLALRVVRQATVDAQII